MSRPRPGWRAQAKMAPQPRAGTIYPLPPGRPKRQAGVLILLYPMPNGLSFVLTRRTETVARHKGQISLPGGMQEEGETLEQTALRETQEELGVEPGPIEIVGPPLTPIYIPASDFWVTAFVGYAHTTPVLHFQPEEVDEIIQVPLASLLDGICVREEEWRIEGELRRVPYFLLQDHKVWGATAMILSEFKALLQESSAD